jgi:hypothetical protein
MAIVSQENFQLKLAEILGLDTKELVGFEVLCYAGETLKVQATYLVNTENAEEAMLELRKYEVELKEKKDG